MAVEQVIKISLDDLKALGGIDNLKKSLGETEQSTKSLKQQLREATAEVAQMAEKYGETSKETVQAAKRAAELKDKIEDANDAIMAFKGEGTFLATGKALQSVASGFAAAQGAMGLFGSESESVEKAILKVQSAMALAQGLEGLEDAGRAFTQLKTVAINAFNSIKASIGTTGIGLLVIALGTVVSQWDNITEAIRGTSKEQEIYNGLQKEAIKQSAKEVSQLDTLYKTSQNHTLSLEQRKSAVDKLQEQYPYYFKNISDEAFLNGKATDAYRKLRQAIIDVAMAKAAQQKIEEISAKFLEKEIELNKDRADAVNDYKKAQDETIVRGGTGESAGTTYVRTREEKQYAAKLLYNKALKDQSELQKQLNAELKPYLDIVQKSSGLENTLSSKPIAPTVVKTPEKKTDKTTPEKKTEKKDPLDAINPATGNTYKSELESFKAAQAAQTQAKLDQLNLEDQINSQAYEREKEWSDKKKELAELEAQAKVEMLYLYSDALSLVADAVGENTAVGKAAAVASTIISTYTSAQKAYESQLSIPTIDAPVRASIAAGIAIAGGLLNVKKILSVKTEKSKGNQSASISGVGGSVGSVPRPQFNVAGDAGVNQIASTLANQQPIKAYVVGKEVSTQQSLDRNIVKNATLG